MQIPAKVTVAIAQSSGAFAPTVRVTGNPEVPLALIMQTRYRAGTPRRSRTVFLTPQVIAEIAALAQQQGQQAQGQQGQGQGVGSALQQSGQNGGTDGLSEKREAPERELVRGSGGSSGGGH